LAPKFQESGLYIVDDHFTARVSRAAQIAERLIAAGFSEKIVYTARVNDLLRPDFPDALLSLTKEVFVGAEFGYDEGLTRTKKRITSADIREAARRLSAAGIAERAYFSFMVGLPWEDRSQCEQTVGFAARLANDYGVRVGLSWYHPTPGSELWKEAREIEAVNEAMYDDYIAEDNHMFRCMSRLKPSEVWEIVRTAAASKWLLGMGKPAGERLMSLKVPAALARYYPPKSLGDLP
jgi:radical SAM superfamily enzyme YgiQ (UPF0313 family)